MRPARSRRLGLALLTSVLMLASGSQISAEMLVFANGRALAIKDYRVFGDSVTVTLTGGGEATFDRSLVARIEPDELPPSRVEAAVAPAPPVDYALESRPFADLIQSVALRHGVDPELVHAVVAAESNYEPTARSAVGARGLMQVMPATARALGVRSAARLLDPAENVEAGVKYLKSLIERFDGNLTKALAAYNAGPAAVTRYGGVPPFRETQAYVRRVLARLPR